ncbi:sarcosine oxidase, partial [Solemya velum gill symbiont]
GVCFDCLVEIDGKPNRQACMIKVAEGMRIRRQHGAGE